MITRTNAFVTSDQQTFAELDAAIGHELGLLFKGATTQATGFSIEDLPLLILQNRDSILDLLTTTATSKSRARAINGGRKKRTPKLDAAAVNRELRDQKQ